ncbi:LysM peptidoglycan-binding domain-containing protein [Salirhabdus salicampi]|uniref:LysM peptidoglycan-binding domain-containing protein n=1 Tax=Salirhabdus salicampi TaxID=476102 RepID=UPI0020C3B0A9|nr:LysM peptidoglycan-binding domain-containing protein [Salirhabdus salicampi]
MNIHVVQRGESLWQIAQRYGVPIQQLVEVNDLPSPDQLLVGQAIIVPTEHNHIVQPGESVWNIAQQYGLTIDALLVENQLDDPNVIQPGQVLRVPVSQHVVQSGETLWRISRSYSVPFQTLANMNRLTNPSLIRPGQRLIVPRRVRPVIDVNGYIINVAERGQQILRNVSSFLTYISPFSYEVGADGTLMPFDTAAIAAVAQEVNVSPLMVITNIREGSFSSDLARELLHNEEAKEQLITKIIEVMQREGFTGLNIDFEYVYPEDREHYNQFLRRVVDRLHPLGFSVSTAVAPKLSAEQQGLLYKAHDYKAHGEIVDFVVIMTYEWGYSGGPPMAVAPLSEVRKVIQYALTEMPSEKIMMGMPLYGYDWTLPYDPSRRAPALSPQMAIERAYQYQVEIKFDEKAKSPYYNYRDDQGREHVVWYEDARSVQAKYDLVKELNLRGVSYWVLGNAFSQNWYVLQDNFQIQTY